MQRRHPSSNAGQRSRLRSFVRLRSPLRRPKHTGSRARRRIIAIFALLGPGLIAANAGNDAGGIATYSSVGARYGYDLLWMLVVITASLALVQVLAARMGVVTGKGIAELIREQYGIRWSVFAATAAVAANLGICISDFVGIGAAFSLAGIPPQISVPIAGTLIWLLIIRGSYRSVERIFIWFTLPFFCYPVAAILAHPHWHAAATSIIVPQIHATKPYLLLFIATVGTTITPFMQMFLQSAMAERGVPIENLKAEQRDAAMGAVFADLIAGSIMIATAATLYRHGIHSIESAAQAARALAPFAGKYAELLFAVGLFGASMLAAAILPIASAYVLAETLGYEKGISRTPSEAPVFTGVITVMIAISVMVAMIPHLPIFSILIAVQVVNGFLLPINLVFMWLLSGSREVMGEYRSSRLLHTAGFITIAGTSLLSISLLVVTIFGI